MIHQKENQLSSFLKSQSRNKIVFYKNNIPDITAIDIGYLLSEAIYNLKDLSKLPIKVSFELEKILNAAVIDHHIYGKILAIYNLGILIEPDLKLDFNRFLEKFSNNNTLFVHWEGELDNEFLYFLSKEHGKKISIKNLSHISI